ncbi:MAG: acyltransferase [Lutibacter sp.]|uniref:1-acyl-sn-glycerol-3-phosphate acyltransferase n=1 Tax=Lutibacter sp. TaxID=1925666 RepID=UPI0017E5C310|nr:1-acyl-sn-glycerol-3-phosphate acyltransferase [Lutibacter sp.]MBT8316216.1 1-acyl-sn-glycerol-3-phosphate acyltransferase [Lutibacter sp.]NNJ57076.1 acyltransferase [Lutibacter sp.]
MKYFFRFTIYTILRWKTVGSFPKQLKKYVIIAAPHTHWIDFPLAVSVKFAEGAPINYIGKASLFKPPFGFIFRWLGGSPVDRTKSNNRVDGIVEVFNNNENFILALSPEGTRKKVDKWKTGFYYIAKGANVPIVMATLNFKKKEVKISEPYYLTNDMEKDFNFFHDYFKGVVGKIPENS